LAEGWFEEKLKQNPLEIWQFHSHKSKSDPCSHMQVLDIKMMVKTMWSPASAHALGIFVARTA